MILRVVLLSEPQRMYVTLALKKAQGLLNYSHCSWQQAVQRIKFSYQKQYTRKWFCLHHTQNLQLAAVKYIG